MIGGGRVKFFQSAVTRKPFAMSNHLKIGQNTIQAEIDELSAVLSRLGASFESLVERILATDGKVVVAGVGKSGIIGHKIAATLASTGTPSVFVDAAEALHGDLGIVNRGDLVIMLSNSAATTELAQMLPSLREVGVPLVGFFGDHATPLAQACDILIDLRVSREACPLNLAPMSSSIVALAVGDALAAALMEARAFKPEQFAQYHPGGSLGRRLLLRVQDVMHPREGAPVVAPTATVREALVAMSYANLGGVVILDGDSIIGVFTDGDLRRHILDGGSLQAEIRQVMTRDPIRVGISMRLGEALETMETAGRRVYFVPVEDGEGCFCGALRMHDILD